MNRLAKLRQAHGWSQQKLYLEMARQAEIDGQPFPAWSSMKPRISFWENGKVVPEAPRQRLLAAVLQVEVHELGFEESATPPTAAATGSSVPSAAITPELVRHLGSMFSSFAETDRMIGPRMVLDVVRAQCQMIEKLCGSARQPVRDELLKVGAHYFELGGWLAQDSGDFDAAASLSTKALDMAYESGDAWMISYTFMRRSNIATDNGNATEGLSLAHAALRDGVHLGPKLAALSLRQLANAQSLLGDEKAVSRAIEEALDIVDETGEPEPFANYCTPQYVQMEGASAWLRLGRPDRAATLLTTALDTWPSGDQRDRGIGVARLATAHTLAGAIDAACEVGRDALSLANTASSARAISELSRLRNRLTPWRRIREVAELTDQIRTLT
jgi:transcriptional regulator with XRE-family HTH domain